MKNLKGLSVAFLCFSPTITDAAEPLFNSYETFQDTRGGEPVMCGVGFTVILPDHIYRQGVMTGVSGSLYSLVNNSKQLIFGLKFQSVVDGKFIPINTATLATKTTIYKADSFACEDQRLYCASFSGRNIGSNVLEAMGDGTAQILFNYTSDGLDLKIPIDIRKAKNPQDLDTFTNCNLALLRKML